MSITTSRYQDNALSQLIGDKADFSISIDAGDVLSWVNAEFEPDEVFDTEKLTKWAEDNGYVMGA